MSSVTMLILMVCIIALLFLVLNFILAPHNPYQEKYSIFECGFHSFFQSRSPFNISFFVYGFLYLIFDLEILLLYPYAMSAADNGIYGLITILIFTVIVTIGFVYELFSGALVINSRQNASKKTNISASHKTTYISGLPLHKIGVREFSTSSRKTKSSVADKNLDFWRKVNSSNKLDINNPFILVNSFLKNYPNQELAKENINIDLINSILSLHISEFNLSTDEFNKLINIEPVRLNLPVDQTFTDLLGKYVRNQERGVAGVYKFTNKINGFSYIGSSISLRNRLSTGYFVSNLKNRVIDIAIKEVGLEQFYLDVYIIPKELEVSTTISKLKSLSLALEQMLILEFNPEYNVLKVAGSPAGNKRSLESMLPSFMKSRKPTFLYDKENKKLLYVSESRSELNEILKCGISNVSQYIKNNELYLNQFIITEELLNESEYETDIKSKDDLLSYVTKIKLARRKVISNNLLLKSSRENLMSKLIKKVKLTNVNTLEVLEFESLTATATYLKELDPKFAKAAPGTLSDNIKKGSIYKGLFKLEYIN